MVVNEREFLHGLGFASGERLEWISSNEWVAICHSTGTGDAHVHTRLYGQRGERFKFHFGKGDGPSTHRNRLRLTFVDQPRPVGDPHVVVDERELMHCLGRLERFRADQRHSVPDPDGGWHTDVHADMHRIGGLRFRLRKLNSDYSTAAVGYMAENWTHWRLDHGAGRGPK